MSASALEISELHLYKAKTTNCTALFYYTVYPSLLSTLDQHSGSFCGQDTVITTGSLAEMADYIDLFAVIYNALLPALIASIGFNLWFYRSRAVSHPHTDDRHPAAQPTQLPSGWWTDESRFQAEKRAIFSQVRPLYLKLVVSTSIRC